MQETPLQILGREDPRLPTPVFLGFPGGSDSKESPAMRETWVQFLGWEDLLEEGILQEKLFFPLPIYSVKCPGCLVMGTEVWERLCKGLSVLDLELLKLLAQMTQGSKLRECSLYKFFLCSGCYLAPAFCDQRR